MTAAPAPTLISRLRERGVLRVAASYGVIAWLLVQIASTVFPVFHLPEWSTQAAIMVAAVGFVVACALAWFLEATPDGVRVDRHGDATERPRAVGWRRYLDVVAIAVLVVVVVLLVADRNRRQQIGARADKSVAVLPFVNMS